MYRTDSPSGFPFIAGQTVCGHDQYIFIGPLRVSQKRQHLSQHPERHKSSTYPGWTVVVPWDERPPHMCRDTDPIAGGRVELDRCFRSPLRPIVADVLAGGLPYSSPRTMAVVAVTQHPVEMSSPSLSSPSCCCVGIGVGSKPFKGSFTLDRMAPDDADSEAWRCSDRPIRRDVSYVRRTRRDLTPHCLAGSETTSSPADNIVRAAAGMILCQPASGGGRSHRR